MLVSPYRHIKELRYLVWDLTGTIDAMPIKLNKLGRQEKREWAIRYRDILIEGVMGYHRKGIRNVARRVLKDCLENSDEDLLTIIKEIGKGVVGEGLSPKETRNARLALLFKEIGEKIGFVEPGYNDLVADFINSRRDFIHYLITNVPEEPAKVVLSALGLLSSFEQMYFYIIKPRSKFYSVLKQIMAGKRPPEILVIDDDYFAGLDPANYLRMNTAWVHSGSITPEHHFHPTIVAESPNELVIFLNNKFPKNKNS